ncbi:hypothetical protein E3O47_07540 [Cryobacterium sp. TMT2-17-1]|uniref:hypothetical protein n=1 Tax=Cryobacterium sp. TMT2-17-1 TaxID=1259248 RepID=UPI00106C07B8|nr:hypothetical protein [Cryobacterium sp. TMT2-17-1]TFC50852.1 hypothetical protein E3O47_07540 [Cryobacterium sp. TMT2-17-1]
MAYWWASQGRNYETAIVQGTLWTSPWPDGTLRQDRTRIKAIRNGDLVFHYAHGFGRAVSRVIAEWVPASRPTGYPKRTSLDLDAGWLVRVEPIATDLALDWHELPELLAVGAPGPMDRNGVPQEKYLSVITGEEGQRLLERLGISVELGSTNPRAPASVDAMWERGETDATTIGRRRREQGRLRAYLLDGRNSANCDICGHQLPASLLVAAHIKPRAVSDEEHRKDFASIAMLACALGCDELFELGYVIVDEYGVVKPGRNAETDALQSVVDRLVGGKCTAHNSKTADDFADRLKLVMA